MNILSLLFPKSLTNQAAELGILTGNDAASKLKELLAPDGEDSLCPWKNRDLVVGYFPEPLQDGTKGFSCFDNKTGDCWCEWTKDETKALAWCKGEIEAENL